MSIRLITVILSLLNVCFAIKYICTLNHTVSLESETVAFIETPNFPRFLTDEEKRECFFNFTKNVVNGEIRQRFMFVVTNVICADAEEDFCPRDNIMYENKTSIYFDLRKHNYYNTSLGYSAFQGYVIFDDWGNEDCPLESVSRIDPFYFTDETEIIKIQSTFFEFQNRTHPCLWQFSAPEGFGFKLSITNLNILNNINFTVENSTVIITNENLVRRNFPYYNNDKYLKIYLSGNKYFNVTRMEFEGYITIIKNDFVETEDNCYTETSEDELMWTNVNKNSNGYPNNAYCFYNLIVQPGTEVIVSTYASVLEDYADHLYYYPEGNESRPIDHNLENGGDIVFYTNDNESEREILWEFTSDGSWQSHGFKLVFESVLCSCADSIMSVSCFEESTYHLMQYDDNFYCGNLECNFTIKLDSFCTKSHIKLDLLTSTNEDNSDNTNEEVFDIFRFISNDYIQLEINHTNRYVATWTLYMSAETNNSFSAITVPSFFPRVFELTLSTFDVPENIPTIELTESSPYYSYYLCPKLTPIFFLIKLSADLVSKNVTIDIHSATEDIQEFIAFYNNKNITQRLNFKNCFLFNSPYEVICKTKSFEFIVTQFNLPYDEVEDEFESCSVILFQSSTVYTEHCVFENNVYNISLHQTLSVTAVSKPNKTCTLFFILTPTESNCFIESIWLSPHTNESLEIYVGTETKLLALIESKSASTWKDILINDLIYAIKIPSNSAVKIDIARYYHHLNISTFPYQSVLTSPRYGITNFLFGGFDDSALYRLAAFKISNLQVNFTIQIFNASSSILCYFDSNGTVTSINASLESIIFEDTELGIFCECLNVNDYCTESFEFYISIHTIDNYEIITTTKPFYSIPRITTTKFMTPVNGESQLFSTFDFTVIFFGFIVLLFYLFVA